MSGKHEFRRCAICGGKFAPSDVVHGNVIRGPVVELIQSEHPTWSADDYICHKDLARFRSNYVHALLESEKGDLTTLEHEVLESLRRHELISANIEDEIEEHRTLGERLADRIAMFGGSWTFLICFGVFIFLWVLVNSLVLYWRPADPYPFILLNLLLSCLASIQAPIIMMSQNRQEAKDRLRSQHDYQVNLKAELEIRTLHEKMDHLLSHQWERLAQMQEIQIDLLNELRRGK